MLLAVHPHVRGDGADTGSPTVAFNGSPPRAWGRLWPLLVFLLLGRFTPTCVGTATCAASMIRAFSVHPHVRGDGSHA